MPKCQDCEEPIVFIRDASDTRWIPSIPITELAYQEAFVLSDEGRAAPLPQVYARHACLSPAERHAKALEREREKQRLIEEDRARRAEAERIRREAEEYERERREAEERTRREQEEALELARWEQRQEQQRRFLISPDLKHYPERILKVGCPTCAAPPGDPCLSLSPSAKIRRGNKWCQKAHFARYAAADPAPLPRRVPRFGDDYTGPWPPARNHPGAYEMRTWLAQNFTIFDADGYRDRDWLTRDEELTMTRWLRENRSLFDLEESDAGPEHAPDSLHGAPLPF